MNWAQVIDEAHEDSRLLVPISDTEALTLADAYAVQDELTARRIRRGARRVGWKLGYTSDVMRAQMHVDAPNHGPLLDTMLLSDGGTVSPRLVQPRVEPEIALELARDLAPQMSPDELAESVARSRAALEVVDSVWVDYRFTLPDNTADGSSAAQVVLGADLAAGDLAGVEVELSVDGRAVARGDGSLAMGHPLTALRWLVEALAARGERVRAGDVVITGGLCAAVPLDLGGTVSARFAEVSVSVKRERLSTLPS